MQPEMDFPRSGGGTRGSSLVLIIALHLMVVWFLLQRTGKIDLFTDNAPARITQVSMLSAGADAGTASATGLVVTGIPAPALPHLAFGPSFVIQAEATTEDAATVHAALVTQAQNPAQPGGEPSASMAERAAGSGTGTGTGTGSGNSAGPANLDSLPTAVLAVECDTPAYPYDARQRGQEGTTRMALLIDAQGRVAESRVMKSSRSLALDRASRNAVALCRFVPPMQNGVHTGGWVSLNYNWKLKETMGVFRDGP